MRKRVRSFKDSIDWMTEATKPVLLCTDSAMTEWHSLPLHLYPFDGSMPSSEGSLKPLPYSCTVKPHPSKVLHIRSTRSSWSVVVQNPRSPCGGGWKTCSSSTSRRRVFGWRGSRVFSRWRTITLHFSKYPAGTTGRRGLRSAQCYYWSRQSEKPPKSPKCSGVVRQLIACENGGFQWRMSQLGTEDPPSIVPRTPW